MSPDDNFDLELQPPLELTPHHRESIANLVDDLEQQDEVLALVLGGSIAHGFASPSADIDFTAVVSSQDYERRGDEHRLTYTSRTPCTYEGGYVDGKFVDMAFLRLVAESGSEPARFAYKDARILFTRDSELQDLLGEIVRYPSDDANQRMVRFAAQILAWRWYYSEALEKQSRYLKMLSVQKLALFSCRLVLTANELLYPFHKWVLRVTESAAYRPETLMADLDGVLEMPTQEIVDEHCRRIIEFYGLDYDKLDAEWGGHFLADTELTWMTGHAPIDDL